MALSITKNTYTDLIVCIVIGTYYKDSISRAILSDLRNFRIKKELDGNLTNNTLRFSNI